MQPTEEMEKAIAQLERVEGWVCNGLVNYRKGVSAINEDSDPEDQSNFFPQQCTAIIKTLESSLNNLQGGKPDKLIVEASNMTMMIYPVDDTYFCGVGLKPGTELKEASQKLTLVREAFKKALSK
jgi:predicted regulator of Ras-like GTPase activity (Roadblock/LC7/MglB family)